jgi:hypothetical protein
MPLKVETNILPRVLNFAEHPSHIPDSFAPMATTEVMAAAATAHGEAMAADIAAAFTVAKVTINPR